MKYNFLRYSAFCLTGLTILPSWTMANGIRIAPSDMVVWRFIGLRRQWCSDFNSFSSCPGVHIIEV